MARQRKKPDGADRPDWALRLTGRRKAFGGSQAAIASALGISQSAYADYETGRSEPSMRMFASLANVLDTKAVWLAYGYGDPDGEEDPLLLETPALSKRRKQDTLFLAVSNTVISVLKEENFYPNDPGLIVVMSEKIVDRIRTAYSDTAEAVEMGIDNADFHLTKAIREAKEELRIKLLTEPTAYLPFPKGPRWSR